MNRDLYNIVAHTFVLDRNRNFESKVNTDKTLIKCAPVTNNPLKCKICFKVFDRKSSFVLHQSTHLDDRPKTCKVCQKTFIDRISLQRHILTENHLESLAYKKDYILKCKDSYSELQKKISNQTVLDCQICNETCRDESVLNYHLLQHELSADLMYENSVMVCQKTASGSNAMLRFQGKTVTIKKSLNELDSSNIFNGKNSLSHVTPIVFKKYKKKLKSFQCNKCKKVFENSNSLPLHFCNSSQLKTYNQTRKLLECNIPQESDEKNTCIEEYEVYNEELICSVCKQHFKSKSDLNSHLKRHSGDKFVCEDCQEAFDDRRSLECHRKFIGKKKFACKICEEFFCCTKNLINHSKVHDGSTRISCDICSKSFLTKYNLYLHYFSHSTNEPTFICPICLKTFSTRNNWVSHYCIHIGVKPLLCEICNKLFFKRKSLYLHCRIHTDEKPYTCEICKKAFKYFNSMLMHKRTH